MEKTSSTIIDKAEEIGVDVLDRAIKISRTVIEKANTMADGINNSQNKPHKIIMLGGRRSGKSSVLACIIDQLEENTPGNICTAVQVDSGHRFYDENNKFYRSYSVNSYLTIRNKEWTFGLDFRKGGKLENLKSPSKTIWIAERFQYNNLVFANSCYDVQPSNINDATNLIAHNGRKNYGFYDGHIVSYTLLSTMGTSSNYSDPRGFWIGE